MKLRLRELLGDAIKNAACLFALGGASNSHTTDAEGAIEVLIPFEADSARLDVGCRHFEIRIDHLDPVEEVSGQEIQALSRSDPAAAVALAESVAKELTSLAETVTAAEIEKTRIKTEANEKGIAVDREDALFLSQGKPNGKFAPIARASSWVVAFTHASKLGAVSADGRLTAPDLVADSPPADLNNAPADFE